MNTAQTNGISRRTFLGGATAASAGALLINKGWIDAAAFFGPEGVDVQGLKNAGYEIRHTICHQCGAACGLTGLVKTDTPASEAGFVVFGNQNPDHPQRGMCGRGATAKSTWDSPLRLKKPMKLVGPRGSGQFEEISWEQAFDEIAEKLKAIVDRDGARSVCFARHNFADEAAWLAMPLNTPNLIGQASTCNTAGVVARRWMMGSGFHHHASIDPDYENVRFVLFPGRALSAPVGAQHRLAKARERGAKVAFLNPAHPDTAYGDSEWLSCVPGTDAAFMLAMARVLIDENRYDENFVRRYTNLPYLIKPDGQPLTQADLEHEGDENLFKVSDGEAVVDHNQEGLVPNLAYSGVVTLKDGSEVEVNSAWNLLVPHLADYTPAHAAKITGVPERSIVRIARTLHIMQGIVEDTWYNTRNGNDTDAVMALMTVNGLLGNFDKPGGLCFRPGHGVPGMLSRSSDGTIKTPLGKELQLPSPGKSIDKELYPETNGTFEAVVKSVVDGDAPYAIKALFLVDATLFQRDPNTRRIEEMLRKLDLVVMTDILHQEVSDWSDYVLPSDMFLERRNLRGVSWTFKPTAVLAQAVAEPPPDADVRPLDWMMLEILRRIHPDRARALGYEDRFVDPAVFKGEFLKKIEDTRIEGLARNWDRDPVHLKEELLREGFVTFRDIEYGNVPYKRPFNSPSGKLEIYAFHPVRKGYREHGFARQIDPQAFTMPKGSREFYLVSGKSPGASSGVAGLAFSSQYLADNAVWINPADAERLQIKNGDDIEIEGIDTGWRATTHVKVTPRIHPGALFAYSYVGGNRQHILQGTPGFESVSNGINSHWFATGWVDPTTGSNFNNASVRIRRVV